MKKIMALVAALVLSGCASPVYNYQPTAKQFSIPQIGVTTTTYVGEEMVKQGLDASYEALHFDRDTQVGDNFYYVIPAGDYLKVGDKDGYQYFNTTNLKTGAAVTNRIMVTDPVKNIQIKPNKDVCLVTIFNATKCDSNKDFKVVKVDTSAQSSFQQNLIYNGKVGNKINIGYREYSGGMTRPDFSNEVEYDLSESKTIRYKGVIIEIISADNQAITFKLVRNFNS